MFKAYCKMTLTLAEPMTIERNGKTIEIPVHVPFEIEIGDIVKDYKGNAIALGFMQEKKQDIPKPAPKIETKEALNG